MTVGPASHDDETFGWEVVRSTPLDARAAPMLAELESELSFSPWAAIREQVIDSETSEAPEPSAWPDGSSLLLVLERDRLLGGGVVRRYDQHTIDISHVWSAPVERQRDVLERLFVGFETEARHGGFVRVHVSLEAVPSELLHIFYELGYAHRYDARRYNAGKTGGAPGAHEFEKPVDDPDELSKRIRRLRKARHKDFAHRDYSGIAYQAGDSGLPQGDVPDAGAQAAQNGWRLDSGYI